MPSRKRCFEEKLVYDVVLFRVFKRHLLFSRSYFNLSLSRYSTKRSTVCFVCLFFFLAFSMAVCCFFLSSSCAGKLLLPPEHRPCSDHEAEEDPLRRGHGLHEGGASHPHPHPAAGNPVRHSVLDPGGRRQQHRPHILNTHLLPLPGTDGTRLSFEN